MPRSMTLLTFRRDDRYALGVKTERGILDVAAAAATALPAPSDMDDLLQNGKGGLLRAVIDATPAQAYLREDTLIFGPLVTRPEKIILVGFNYKRHAEEVEAQVGPHPVLFNKYNNTLNAHGGRIRPPVGVAREFDYETELVVVLGREARDIPEAEALDCVTGYCVGNDFSARLASADFAGHARQEMRRLRPARPLPRHQRPRRRPAHPPPGNSGERRNTAGLDDGRHDLRLPQADQLHVAHDDDQAR